VKDTTGTPIPDIDAADFEFTLSPDVETRWFGMPNLDNLSCSFTPVDDATNETGTIRFTIISDTSIIGNITITVTVDGILINDSDVLLCNSVDLNTDGTINLVDVTLFIQIYFNPVYDYRIDYNWDGVLNLSDIALFAQHLGHTT